MARRILFRGLALLSLLALAAHAEIIDSTRRYPWTNGLTCGITNGIPDYANWPIHQTLNPGATPAEINSALSGCPAGQKVVLTAGTYSLDARIDMLGEQYVALVGAGKGQTILSFTAFSSGAIIYRATGVSEAAMGVEADLTADWDKGSTTITIGGGTPSWVRIGDLIGIDQLDESFVDGTTAQEPASNYRALAAAGSNGERGMGMLNAVLATNATTITVEMPSPYTFKVSQTAQIWQPSYNPSTVEPMRGSGIADMTIDCTFSSGGARMIKFERTMYCWVNNVTITNAADTPIWNEFSYRNEIKGCDLMDPRLVGSGQGYATPMYYYCAGMLVWDCVVQGSHNALTANFGGAGNVWAYNYVRRGTISIGQIDAMNTHGVHPMFNLWEGNFCEDKVLADWTHGSSSHNTFFRNRVSGQNGTGDSRTPISIERMNRYWNLVGNIVGTVGTHNKRTRHSTDQNGGSQGTCFHLGGDVNISQDWTPADAYSYTSGLLLLDHMNYDTVTSTNGGIQLEQSGTVTDQTLLDSMFTPAKPVFFGFLSWPPYNPLSPGTGTNTMSHTNIPAGYRAEFGTNPPSGDAGGGVAGEPTRNKSIRGLRLRP